MISINSGGAKGSDCYWSSMAKKECFYTVMHSFPGHHYVGKYDEEIFHSNFELEKYKKICENVWSIQERNWKSFNWKKLQLRNCAILDPVDIVFAVGYFNKQRKISGGTGSAVLSAILMEKFVYFYDQERELFYRVWKGDENLPNQLNYAPIHIGQIDWMNDTQNFVYAGIGTRKLNPKGKNFIEKLTREIKKVKLGI